jgi:uncharacterized protein (TIRG00374 family)
LNTKDIEKKIIFSVIIGMLIFSLNSLYSDAKELMNVFIKFNYIWLPVILILAPLNYTFRFLKWNYYLKLINVNIRLRENIIIFLSGFSMTITPGKLGELLKTYMLKQKYCIPISLTAPLVFTERLTDAISMLILSCFGMLAFNYGVGALTVISIVIIAGIIIVQNKSLCLKIIDKSGKIPFLKNRAEQLHNFYNSTFVLFKWKSLLIAVLIGVISWAFEGFVIYYTLLAMGYHISILASIFVVSFSSIIGAVTMLPGGLFAAEGSIIGILILMGFPKVIAGGATIVTRFATLWLGVIIGILFLFIAGRMGLLSTQNQIRDMERV